MTQVQFFEAGDFIFPDEVTKEMRKPINSQECAEWANKKLSESGVRVQGANDGAWFNPDLPGVFAPKETHTALLIDIQPIKKEPVVFEHECVGCAFDEPAIINDRLKPFYGKKVKVTVEEVG